jgi:putative FmdB family regulatory protein
MPLYEYRCADCGHEIEVLRKIADPAPVECPACHHPSLQKKLTAAGFQLKGTGWYVTDFRGGANSRSDKTAEAGAAPAPAGDGTAAAAGSSTAPATAPATTSTAPSPTPTPPNSNP